MGEGQSVGLNGLNDSGLPGNPVREELQAVVLALLRMELRREHVVLEGCRYETIPVLGRRRDRERIIGHEMIAVDEIEGRVSADISEERAARLDPDRVP